MGVPMNVSKPTASHNTHTHTHTHAHTHKHKWCNGKNTTWWDPRPTLSQHYCYCSTLSLSSGPVVRDVTDRATKYRPTIHGGAQYLR